MRIKTAFYVIPMLGFLTALSVTTAQNQEKGKYGVVDLKTVFDQYEGQKFALGQLKDIKKMLDAKLEGLAKEAEKIQKELEALSPDAANRRTLEDRLDEKITELKISQMVEDGRFEREKSELEKKIETEVGEGLAEYARVNGYDMIFDVIPGSLRGIPYYSPERDVTNDFAEKLNARWHVGRKLEK